MINLTRVYAGFFEPTLSLIQNRKFDHRGKFAASGQVNNEILSGLLNDRGFKCNYCISSEEGIKEFKNNSYSLVILDIWLNNSKFDGFQTLEEIKELNDNVPVIMISGHGNIETAVNSIKKGAYDFIEKPLDGDLLIFKVSKALENYDLKNKVNNLYQLKNNNYVANA